MYINDPHSLAKAALVKMAQQNIDPGLYIQAAANSGNPGMQKVASAIIRYDQAQQRTKQAFVQGALSKLAEYGIDAGTFVNAANYSGDAGLQKIASAIVDYANSADAYGGMQKEANLLKGVRRSLGNLFGRGREVTPPGPRLLESVDLPPGPNWTSPTLDAPGRGPGSFQVPSSPPVNADPRFSAGQIAAGTLGLGALGAGGYGAYNYATGDSGTTGSQWQDLANQYLGTDFDQLNRYQAWRQGLL